MWRCMDESVGYRWLSIARKGWDPLESDLRDSGSAIVHAGGRGTFTSRCGVARGIFSPKMEHEMGWRIVM